MVEECGVKRGYDSKDEEVLLALLVLLGIERRWCRVLFK